ncbi:MAG: 2-oxoglutarate dehydrogenase E1 component [Myxococcota bacterium]
MASPMLVSPDARRVAQLYERYRSEPAAVEPAWQEFFRSLDEGARGLLDSLSRGGAPLPTAPASEAPASGDTRAAALDSIRVLALIDAYRTRGHLEAKLDPLRLRPRERQADLDPRHHGFDEADLDRPVFVNGELGLDVATPREIVRTLRRIYCGAAGVEYMHILDPEQRAWIQASMEGSQARFILKPGVKRDILENLAMAETFERFLHRKFVGTKRFGLDGAESAIPALEAVLTHAVESGVEEVVIGMSHRGRLNVLANVMGKPLEATFAEFHGIPSAPLDLGSGDVKYHLGTSSDRKLGGRALHLSMNANPSHLEAVDPVVLGKTRAKQVQRRDTNRSRVIPILIHGDAAFTGQGIVPETLDLSHLDGYRTGGTLHLIIDNQIGFTTNPVAARSGPYCSDVAKVIQAPIGHVNGDDPEMVVLMAGFATQFRQTFHNDAIIDLFCYRRFGHNEADEPAFTQPIMYRKIEEQPSTLDIYSRRLIEEGVVSEQDVEEIVRSCRERLEVAFERSTEHRANQTEWLDGAWSGLQPVQGYDARRGKTAVDLGTLREVGEALTRVPEGFQVHRKITRQLDTKRRLLAAGKGLDWATAEALAFGTLLIEGNPVRLTGQDVSRGTFSHRHAALVDQVDERRHVPLNHIRDLQEQLEVVDSPLSEVGALGFEFGYSLADPRTLVLWEAQFGDFANGAQVIIDQFVAASESKWLRMSGLVLLLPHGYEGQGPEHSSARLERFLQLCAEDNLQVVNCTTPANYFHVLRRQMHRAFRKPLIVMSPKSLLRHKQAVSDLEQMGRGSGFHRVMHCDELPSDPTEARQLVMCSGKLYYELDAARKERGASDVHFLRIEQLYPFPEDALAELMEPYRHCHLVWCQEEPRNMGAWNVASSFVQEVAEQLGCKHPLPRYAGRPTAASPATGSSEAHRAEQARLIDDALTIGRKAESRIASRRAAAGRRGTDVL